MIAKARAKDLEWRISHMICLPLNEPSYRLSDWRILPKPQLAILPRAVVSTPKAPKASTFIMPNLSILTSLAPYHLIS